MTDHLNLLPYAVQRRRLIADRLRQWCAVWLAAAGIAAAATWFAHSRGEMERDRLAALERRYVPLKQLEAKTKELRAKIADLRERETLALTIAEERPMAVLLGELGRAAAACGGNVCITKMVVAPAVKNAAIGGVPQSADAHKTLQLEGLGVDNASVARFAAELRDAKLFSDVRLKSSVETQIGPVSAVSYKLDCGW